MRKFIKFFLIVLFLVFICLYINSSSNIFAVVKTSDAAFEKVSDNYKELNIPQDIIYTGYICFLEKSGNNMIDVYIRPNEDCSLQAFDIRLDTEKHSFEIISHTGKDIQQFEDKFNLLSIANGLEMPLEANKDYKLATIVFENISESFQVKVIKADFAIAFTPMQPEMDLRYLDFDPILSEYLKPEV